MSRIVVKNLPNKIVEDDVRKFFSEIGPLTDVKLKYKKGDFRGFCFIGFEKEEDGKKAQKRFHNSYFKQNKISIEPYKVIQASEENAASVDKKSKSVAKIHGENTAKSKLAEKLQKDKEVKADPTFRDYLQLNSGKGASVANVKGDFSKEKETGEANSIQETSDEVVEADCNQAASEETEEPKISTNKAISDLDYLKSLKSSDDKEKTGLDKNKNWVDLHTVVIRIRETVKRKDVKGKILTKKNVKEFFKPLKLKSLRIPRHDSSVAFVGFTSEKIMKQALQKDKSFINGVRVKVQFHHPVKNDAGQDESGEAPWSAAAERLRINAEPVAESGKLFVRNLWYSATEESLKEFFEKIGPVSDVTVPLCKTTRKAKGFAHISYVFPEHAVKAMTDLDGKTFKGRILHILPSLKKEENEIKEEDSFKVKKQKQQKATANSWHNWNSLFLSSDAIIDLMAEKYGRTKKEILDNEGDQSAAVNLVLGETQLVDECRKFLENSGICLDVFTDPNVQRSSTVILAKNLAPRTTASELREVFEKYGHLGRIVMPPSGVTGVIEYLDSGEAKYAFNRLAYSRFKNHPLYLEWAPVKTFNKPEIVKGATASIEDSAEEPLAVQQEEVNPEPNTTLYVKNLNFVTNEEILKTHFAQMGEVCSVLIAKKRNLSQGYGFVQYLKAKEALKALRELQDSLLDGHNIQIKKSEKILKSTTIKRKVGKVGEQQSSKILVKNIPFHATTEEIKQLFRTFGHLKLVRLPLKPGLQEHRGFGFVEYVTEEDAKKAFESLCHSSHLYGRRLVLEWAKDEESIEELRKKTADQFLSSNARGPPTKKSRLDVTNLGNTNDDNFES